MPTSGTSSAFNIEVGRRLRQRRILVGSTQAALGKRLGITFQQVQKYEKGTNGLSAARLLQVAGVLEVPVMYFFEGQTETGSSATESTVLQRRELQLVRGLRKVPEWVTSAVEGLVSSVAEAAAAKNRAEAERAPEEPDPSVTKRRRKRGAAWDWADVKAG